MVNAVARVPDSPRADESIRGGAAPLSGDELLMLRSLLIGPLQKEAEAIRARIDTLEDSEHQTRVLADRLAAALMLRPPTDPGVARALGPAVEGALGEALAHRPQLLARAVGFAVLHGILHPFTLVARVLANPLRLFCAPADDGDVLEQLLIHRGTHALIDRVAKDVEVSLGRRITEMVTYLQHSMRDGKLLERYAQIETIRIEKLTYAIHVGPLASLLSVIAGGNTKAAVARCRKQLEAIHGAHTVALGDFDPGNPPAGLLSGQGIQTVTTMAS